MGTYTFGNSDPFVAQRFEVIDGSTQMDNLILPKAKIEDDNYLRALEDINLSLTILEDIRTGKRFEFALGNVQADPSEGIDVELSTFTSSISGNIGNAIEFAEHCALNPDRQRLYIASFGNGGSSYWDKTEQRYIKRTGRFINTNGEALPTIAALERVLRLGGYMVTKASTNSAGGAYATALMGALPEGQVTHAYIKSRPNISDHPTRLLWGLSMIAGDMIDDKKYKAVSRDAWKLDDSLVDEARAVMSNIYPTEADGVWSMKQALKGHGLGQLWSDMVAFSKASESHRPNSATIDTLLALHKQPNVLLTYHAPEKDRLYKKIGEVIRFIEGVDLFDNTGRDTGIQALIMPGTHRDHTQYPALRWTFENYAFSRER